MKKKIIGCIIAAFLLALIAGVFVWMKNKPLEEDAAQIKAAAGEEVIYATIDQITGNDIEVTILSDAEVERIEAINNAAEQMSEAKQDDAGGGFDMSAIQQGGMPDMSGGGFPDGGFPGGRNAGGGMPDMSGGGFPGSGNAENGMPDNGQNREIPESTVPEEIEAVRASYRIPVGTDVITTLGATTTFSHLEEGDTIAILLEQESGSILKVWMVM